MVLIINIIAAVILFLYPIKFYRTDNFLTANHPFEKAKWISINPDLAFLVFSVLTAMVFLGPLSLVKYAYWTVFLIYLVFNRLEIKFDGIVGSYCLFLLWAVVSAILFSSVPFQATMMLVKYFLPLLYLWLGYTAIKDSDDLLYFLKMVAIGMCIYALLIGGFSAKFLSPLYAFLNFKSGGLFISYASLADYFSSLIVVPIALFLITNEKKWIYATLWIILSTVLETVRTGLGGIFLATSLFLLTIYRMKSIPWIIGLCLLAVGIVFTVPSFREKMFMDQDTSISTFSTSDANFQNINSNAREYLWQINLHKFYEPSPITGSGLGESVEWMKNQPGLKLIHSDYVQILCDLGLVGIILLGFFVFVALYTIITSSWMRGVPDVIKLTGGIALGSCAGTFFSMGFDNVIAYAQQSYVIPFVMIGIFLKVKNLYYAGEWDED